MKIIIMTGKFGMGHYVAAEAIRQKIANSKIEASVEIIDWLHYITPNHADKFYRLFSVIMSNGSKFYNQRYRYLENRKTDQRPELCSYFLHQFKKLMLDKQPDLIISTLPICSQIVSLYVSKYKHHVPLITCVTDITGHSEWVCSNTDLYLVGSDLVKGKLIQKGVFPNKIYVTGIPVKSEFDHASPSLPSKERKSKTKVLIMGGGLGILPYNPDFYWKLDQLLHLDITIITGKNQRLYKRLYGKFKNLEVVGYIDNVDEYMKAADVLISKPGGITTFEAIHAGVPIIALNPCLQQEIYNAEYITDQKIGIVVQGDHDQCIKQILSFLEHDSLRVYRQRVIQQKEFLRKNKMESVVLHAIEHLCCNKYVDDQSDFSFGKEQRNEKINFNF